MVFVSGNVQPKRLGKENVARKKQKTSTSKGRLKYRSCTKPHRKSSNGRVRVTNPPIRRKGEAQVTVLFQDYS